MKLSTHSNSAQSRLNKYYPRPCRKGRFGQAFGSGENYTKTGGSKAGRYYSYTAYRYGFNNQEKDGEMGEYYSFEYRVHDARLGRFLSVDPLAGKYPAISAFAFVNNEPIISVDPDGRYQTDGHYWTVYLVGLMMGLDEATAQKIAYYAELPDNNVHDNIVIATNTWLNPTEQHRTHVLNGTKSLDELYTTWYDLSNYNNLSKGSEEDFKEFGRLLHRLGDCFAHREIGNEETMYGQKDGFTTEHFIPDGSEPDMIYIRADLYLDYTTHVMWAIYNSFGDVNQSNTNKINNDINAIHNFLIPFLNYAIQKEISLIGIINFGVSILKNENSFFLPYIQKNIPDNGDDFETHEADVKEFLLNNGIQFQYHYEYEKSDSGKKTGVRFIIINTSTPVDMENTA